MIRQVEHSLTGARNYRIIPLQENQVDDAHMLSALLRDEPEATKDPKRPGFYWVGSHHSVFYINVHDATRTVYLVTVARP